MVGDGRWRITSEFGDNTTRIGSLPPEGLARMMLSELLADEEQRKRLAVREDD
jgi:hypothetical protein